MSDQTGLDEGEVGLAHPPRLHRDGRRDRVAPDDETAIAWSVIYDAWRDEDAEWNWQ